MAAAAVGPRTARAASAASSSEVASAKVACASLARASGRVGEALAEAVAKFAPGDLNKVWFVSGGSEATENAAKLARQYWLERGKPSKSIVIGRWQSFHGNLFGSLGFGGHNCCLAIGVI